MARVAMARVLLSRHVCRRVHFKPQSRGTSASRCACSESCRMLFLLAHASFLPSAISANADTNMAIYPSTHLWEPLRVMQKLLVMAKCL